MDKKAISLMEILVSTIIMALVMTGLANIFVAARRHILHNRSRMVSGQLGKYFLDPFQMQVNQSQWNNNCLSNTALCTTQTQTLDNISYSANYTTSPVGSTALRKVKADITWKE